MIELRVVCSGPINKTWWTSIPAPFNHPSFAVRFVLYGPDGVGRIYKSPYKEIGETIEQGKSPENFTSILWKDGKLYLISPFAERDDIIKYKYLNLKATDI